jgi:hypothetical protein
MDLSIIIVNWNSKDYLRACILSIIASKHDLQYEIVVIDSASFDGSDQMLRAEFPQVKFIQSQENLGFGRANNRAVAASKGNALLFLNPDTEVRSTAISIAYNAMITRSKVGAVGCNLLNTDGSVQLTCIRAFPTLINQALDIECLMQLYPRFQMWGREPLHTAVVVPTQVEAVSGAFIMMARNVFDKIGGFSPCYFMYSEDMDLCYKAHQRGFENLYVPEAIVVHHGGGATAKQGIDSFSTVMFLESRCLYFKTNQGPLTAAFYRVSVFFMSILRLVAVCVVYNLNLATLNRARIVTAASKCRSSLLWSMGLTSLAEKTCQKQASGISVGN